MRSTSSGVSVRTALCAAIALCACCILVSGCSSPVTSEGKSTKQTARTTTARTQYEQGKYAEAESALKVIAEKAPDDKKALNTLALAQAAQGKNDLAIAAYERLTELDADDHVSLYRMAALERVSGNPEDAAAHLEKALEADPGNRAYIDELANAHMDLGHHRRAAKLWKSLLKDDSLTAESRKALLVLIGQAYRAADDSRRAKKAYKAALGLDPENEGLKAIVKSFE